MSLQDNILTFPLMPCRTPRPIVDSSNRIIAVLAGKPEDDSYTDAVDSTYKAFMDASGKVRLPTVPHIRGYFPVLHFGLHYGQGQQRPQRLRLSKAASKMADKLTALPCVKRIAAYVDCKLLVLIYRFLIPTSKLCPLGTTPPLILSDKARLALYTPLIFLFIY